MSTSIRRITIPLAGLLLIGAHAALAVCTPGDIYIRYVGDTATDPECTDNDIQSAIDHAECPDTFIVITREHTYTAQHLDINGKSLTLIGKPPGVTCGEQIEPVPPPAPQVAISGAGHSGDSVLYIHGNSDVTLQYLSIESGNNLGGYGGGIHFDGTGSLVLDKTTVKNNVANYGGGINFSGSGGFAGLTVLGNTQIINNTVANSGGGIRVTGDSYMSILYDSTLVALNHAPDGYGGGINIVGPAHADIGSPGLGVGVVYANDAKYGGGIAVTGGGSDDDDAELQLFSIDPMRPVRVHGNFASSSGGGIYMKSYWNFIGGIANALVCAHDFRIEDNGAPEGSAIFGDNDELTGFGAVGSVFLSNIAGACRGLPPSARRCAADVPCNTISGNVATDADSNPTLGAAIMFKPESGMRADRFSMRDNHGGYAIRQVGEGSLHLSNCLLADNNVTRQLLATEDGTLGIGNCTLAGNTILSTDTIHAEGPMTLINSIIDQPGNLALAYSGGDLLVNYVLSSDTSTLPASEGVRHGVPTFVDAANGDYHLGVTSLGLDYAPHITGNALDLDGLPHDQDLPAVANQWGALDLGAYERQRTFACSVGDTIFCDGFEAQ